MTTLKTLVALLLTATGLLAIYAVSHRWYSAPLGPHLGTRKNMQPESIASSREPAPLLGVVSPRSEEWNPPPMPPGNWYGGLR